MRIAPGFAALLLLCSCSAARSGLETGALNGAEIRGIEDAPLVLTDGEWAGEPYSADSPVRPRAGRVQEFALAGDFTGDGQDEAAVLLWSSGGGSGNFLWISLLASAPGRAHSVATQWVGDRVQVLDFFAEGDQLVLDLVAPGPDDAACCPRQRELRHYQYKDGALEENIEVLGTVSTADLVGPVWRLVDLGHGGGPPSAEATLEFTDPVSFSGVAGCNDFEGAVTESEFNRLSLTATATTMRRCPENMTSTETQYMMRLAATSWFSFVNGRLHLFSVLEDELDALVFERTAS